MEHIIFSSLIFGTVLIAVYSAPFLLLWKWAYSHGWVSLRFATFCGGLGHLVFITGIWLMGAEKWMLIFFICFAVLTCAAFLTLPWTHSALFKKFNIKW